MIEAKESVEQFTKRKAEHIEIALRSENEAIGQGGFDNIQLIHTAMPDVNFDEITIETQSLDCILPSPYLVSSMTAGHKHGQEINFTLATACQEKGWLMGVGSQRRQLFDKKAVDEWTQIRKALPKVKLLGNIGIAQLITSNVSEIQRLLDPIDAKALFVHANPLQECIQPEGTPNFKGGLQALEKICNTLDVPVILKETGCGFSQETLENLNNIGLFGVDISGFGGTHWGRIEGARAKEHPMQQQAAKVYRDWGINTVTSMLNATSCNLEYEIWGSGGVRSGLDAAKLIALGAKIVGFAKPILEAALSGGSEKVIKYMNQVEFELKIALFCCGYNNIKSFQEEAVWQLTPR